MTQIMVAHDKHGNRYLSLEKGLGPTCIELVKERLADGFYDSPPEDKAKAKLAIAATDPTFTAWHFLHMRGRYEYEWVEVVDLEEL